jgi:hypothetical protein
MPDPTYKPPHVYQAIFDIQQEIGPIAKTGRNDFANYSYQQLDEIERVLLPLCKKHNLLLIPEQDGLRIDESGKMVTRHKLTAMSLVDGSTHVVHRDSIVAENKNIAQAFGSDDTYNVRYMKVMLFLMYDYGCDDDACAAGNTRKEGVRKRATTDNKTKEQPAQVAAGDSNLDF